MNKRQKKKRIKMYNKKLCKRYPFLVPRNVWTDEVVWDYDYTWTELNCLEQGWRKSFGLQLMEDLRKELIKSNRLDKFRFDQIKEKYGSLRLYSHGGTQEVFDILQNYEYISQFICGKCGNIHAKIVNWSGWYYPLCEKCWDNYYRFREKGGYRKVKYPVDDDEELELPTEYKVEYYSKQDGDKIVIIDISDISNRIKQRYEKYKRKNA